ncbi:MAG TPA: hypothetical protein VNI77_00015 [Nitrososphaera sp.]|nr:hypothetical protein [Nitrososphaera sp.]
MAVIARVASGILKSIKLLEHGRKTASLEFTSRITMPPNLDQSGRIAYII